MWCVRNKTYRHRPRQRLVRLGRSHLLETTYDRWDNNSGTHPDADVQPEPGLSRSQGISDPGS